MACGAPNYFPPHGSGFGEDIVIPSSSADFGKTMSAAIALAVGGPGGTVIVPYSPTPYEARTPIRFTFTGTCSSLRIVGNGATFRAAASMEALFQLHGTSSTALLAIDDLILDANHNALYGFLGTELNQRTSVVQRVSAVRARQSGFWIRGCQAAVFRDCESRHNALDGYRIEGAFATRLVRCSAANNGRDGFRLASLGSLPSDTTQFGPLKMLVFNASHGPELVGCVSSNNGRDGVHIALPDVDTISIPAKATNAFTLQECQIVGNTRHGVRISEDVRAVILDRVIVSAAIKTLAGASAVRMRSRGVVDSTDPVCKDVILKISDSVTITRKNPRMVMRQATTHVRPKYPQWTTVPTGSCIIGTLTASP